RSTLPSASSRMTSVSTGESIVRWQTLCSASRGGKYLTSEAHKMPEPGLNRSLVEEFYGKVWNQGDEEVARRILSSDLRFRGSTGPVKSGVEEFLGYVRLIRGALSRYECVIEELVSEGERSFARMLFRGIHTGRFFGVAPTGREIAWAGAALFGI